MRKIFIILLFIPIILFCKQDNKIKTYFTPNDKLLQDYLENNFDANKGGIVFLDLKTGIIKAIINKDVIYKQTFSPGSVFKLITGIAALKEDYEYYKKFSVNCQDKFYLIGKGETERLIRPIDDLTPKVGDYFKCTIRNGHNLVNFKTAVAKSCNVFFYNVGVRIGYEKVFDTFIDLKLNDITNVNADNEISSQYSFDLPFKKQIGFFVGDNNDLKMSPLMVGMLMSFIANNGICYQPLFVDKKSEEIRVSPIIFNQDKKLGKILQFIKECLLEVVLTGTAKKSELLNYDLVGKTGTGTSGKNYWESCGWFCGYYPIEKPTLAFCLLLKKGNGTLAAKEIKKIFANFNFEIFKD